MRRARAWGSTGVARPAWKPPLSPQGGASGRPRPRVSALQTRAAGAERGNTFCPLLEECGQPGCGCGSCFTPRRRCARSYHFQPRGQFLRVFPCLQAPPRSPRCPRAAAWEGQRGPGVAQCGTVGQQGSTRDRLGHCGSARDSVGEQGTPWTTSDSVGYKGQSRTV